VSSLRSKDKQSLQCCQAIGREVRIVHLRESLYRYEPSTGLCALARPCAQPWAPWPTLPQSGCVPLLQTIGMSAPVLFCSLCQEAPKWVRRNKDSHLACCWPEASSRQRNNGWFLHTPESVSWSGSWAQFARDLWSESPLLFYSFSSWVV